MIVHNTGPLVPINEAVLFPFDDFSLPFRYLLRPGLVNGTNVYHPHVKVVERGPAGAPDSKNINYYGTVIRIGDELRMWYIGNDGTGPRMCYAVSTDGIHWEKPVLGLRELNGSTQNNLVDFDHDDMGAILVLYEPDDPNPNRRFKLAYEVHPFHIGVAFSPDGLHWQDSSHNPVLKHNALECGGLLKYNGCYYLNGQGGNVGTKRALVTFVSFDFENWSDAVVLGLRRDIPPRRQFPGAHAGEQVHLGASLWNRDNVILGFYGQWHGPESNDRAYVTMDLGFLVSHDALHFVEPIPDFQILSAYEVLQDTATDMVPAPCLEQGQGFENIGDQTLTWYSPWRGGFICVARWPRDRLGYFEVVADPKPIGLLLPEDTHSLTHRLHLDIIPEKAAPHFISCPIQLDKPARVFVNAAELSADSALRVEVLDPQHKPIPGYTVDDCTPLTVSGLRQPVSWGGKAVLEGLQGPIRIKVSWHGQRHEDVYVYAVYVSEEG